VRPQRKGWALMAGLGLAGTALLALAATGLLGGCSTLAYYGQAVGGHLDIVQRSRPVADWLADERTPPALRARLASSQQMRDFAVRELKLPDNASYRRYADLQRDAVVWNLVAAPELSLTLKTWCFPLMGCVGYRGSFERAPAEVLAAELQAQGFETSVYGVPAYSTLGWTNWMGGDPLLNTFIGRSDAELARLMFHELAHQVVYVDDDTAFNESFATAVERLGGQRWLAAHASAKERADDALLLQRREDFRALTLRTRQRLEALYTGPLDEAAKRARKAELMALLRAEYAALKAGPWQGYAGYDGWVARANNASFAVQAAYTAQVPAFEALFQREGGDFARFYAAVQGLAALPKDQRRARLDALAAAADATPTTPPTPP
jgi:predicted aminopeptidase